LQSLKLPIGKLIQCKSAVCVAFLQKSRCLDISLLKKDT